MVVEFDAWMTKTVFLQVCTCLDVREIVSITWDELQDGLA